MLISSTEKAIILALITNHFGASAPWILTQAQSRAASMEELFNVLANAIPEKSKRAHFMADISSAIAEKAPAIDLPVADDSDTKPSLSSHTIKLAELRLMQFIGDKGKNLTASLAPAPQSIKELYQRLSLFIPDDEQRQRFMLLCPQRSPND
jgi:ribonuclease PH